MHTNLVSTLIVHTHTSLSWSVPSIRVFSCFKYVFHIFLLDSWPKGHFTHETESQWPLHFKHSHWWKRRSMWSKFASDYAWGTNGVYECKVDVTSTWIPTWHQMGRFRKPPLGGRPNTKPRDHGNSKCSQPSIYFIFSCVRTRMNRYYRNSSWLRAWS